jgi:hypothetical protein
MTPRLFLRDEAQADIEAAAQWYVDFLTPCTSSSKRVQSWSSHAFTYDVIQLSGNREQTPSLLPPGVRSWS